ncbi:MAG: UDP-N-acetylmuramoyl-L-alanyl-D-glutamate--2,6-diaminopimelate ligase [bacterium]
MKLKTILQGVSVLNKEEWAKAGDVEVTSLSYRSRMAEQGGLFCAWRGEKADGHDFIADAVQRGAVAVVGEKSNLSLPCPYVLTPVGRAALSVIAANFYSRPAEKLRVVGVTGTNGKTSTSLLIRRFLEMSGCKTGLLGTIEYDLGSGPISAERTTPEGLELQQYLRAMVDNGCRAVVMEASSHALEQGRVAGIPYQVAVFTNLTRDHLDYHGTMEAYFAAKLKLFAGLSEGQVAVLNQDREESKKIEDVLAKGVKVIRYGLSSSQADFVAEKINCNAEGSHFTLRSPEGSFSVKTQWIGEFNISNVLAALAAGFGLGLPVSKMVKQAQSQPPVPGRMERAPHAAPFSVIVDYAHTDDAVQKALSALRPVCKGRLKVLVGCGGNRDKTKRPLMAQAACEGADEVVFTSDNPRDEEPRQILDDMLAGVKGKKNFSVIEDRREAIRQILNQPQKGDVILLAGKGHETTQEIRGKKTPFSDREEALKILQGGAA